MRFDLLTLVLLLATLTFAAPPQSPTKPLTHDQLLDLVSGSVSSSRIADLVRERGIDFIPTEEYLQALRRAGADPALVDVVANAKPPKSPAQESADEARTYVTAANKLLGKGDVDHSIPLYQIALQLHPGDAETHRLLGIAFGKKQNWQGDISEQRAALQLDPNDDAARQELDRASRSAAPPPAADPGGNVPPPSPAPVVADDSAARAQKAFAEGEAQLAQRKFEAAAISFSEASQLRPGWPDPLVERAKVYMKLYLFQEAIHSYEQANRLNPGDPVILNLRGYAYYSASQFPQAILDFDAAIRLNPAMAEAFHNRGNAKWQMGDRAGANADFDQAKALAAGASGSKKGRK